MSPARPIPIAIFLTRFEAGGTERQMIELACRLDRSRWEVHLACLATAGPWFDRAAADGVASIAQFPVASLRRAAVARQAAAFVRWCRDRRIAIVHTAQLYANIFGLPAAALARVPVRIGNRRNINSNKTPLQLAAQRAAYSAAHRVVANSQAAAARLRAECVPSRKIVVVRNGIDVDAFPLASRRSTPRRVVVVANLRPGKGHDILIRAAPYVLDRFPDASFDIVGAGPLSGELRAMASQAGVEGSFTFAGHREDVAARLAAADVFVLPSRSESSPNGALEAMASGLPVVASAVGGVGEMIADGRTGLLAPPDDPLALADCICRIMASPALASALGDAARADVVSRYSFDAMIAAFDALYHTELRRRCPRMIEGSPATAAA